MRVLTLVGLSGCASSAETPAATTGAPGDPARGRAVYATTCAACHNVDPTLAGTIGPEVKGASRELLEARLLHAAYPPGYTPKRNTQQMPAQPQLASSIDDLHAYLKPDDAP